MTEETRKKEGAQAQSDKVYDHVKNELMKDESDQKENDFSSNTIGPFTKVKSEEAVHTDVAGVSSLLVSCPKSRKAYTDEEDEILIDTIKSKRNFPLIRGRALWQYLEEKNIIQDRSWQSMKNRFLRSILPRLGAEFFEETEEDSSEELELDMPCRLNRKPYTSSEDQEILKFILKKRRKRKVKGVTVWKRLEERNYLPGRSWQSMKERFLKQISKNLNA